MTYQNLLESASGDKWKRLGLQKRAGVNIPLFSVYSKESIGIGEFSDLKLLIDWAAFSGNSLLQLLPMNETGALFCPYDSLSSFALEPMYVTLSALPSATDRAMRIEAENLKRNFPVGEKYVDYGVKKEKLRLLWASFLKWDHSDSAKFKKFKAENSYWLEDYALYKALKIQHQESPWYFWEDKFKNRDAKALADFKKAKEKEINFQIWVQWQLYQQFTLVRTYAQKKKVLLKGDLPILVSRDSADAWAHPEFFKLQFAAGAPPDMYCAKGQRWGMPTYNWQAIAADDYRYLKEKLKYAENFYDILRIDHVVGLFRIWSIPFAEPLENQGLNGFFDPPDESVWACHGRNLLNTIIKNTRLLLCAEDLGVIPEACTATLKELGIPGNDVQRWVKDWKIKHDFLSFQDFREVSVAMLSTHDTTNWPAWWEVEAGTVDGGLFFRKCSDHRRIDFSAVKEKLFDPQRSSRGRLRWKEEIDCVDKLLAALERNAEEVKDFIDLYENSFHEKEKLWKRLKLKGAMREKCDKEIVRSALKLTLDSSAIFCVNTIFDWLYLEDILTGESYEYRINTPGTISAKNWSLVIPMPLEELLKHRLAKEMRKMAEASGRSL